MSFRKNIISHLPGRIFYKFIDTFNIILLGKLFDDWTMGQYNMFIMESSIVLLALNFGLGSSVQYFVSKKLLQPKKVSIYSTVIMIISLFVLVGVVSVSLESISFNYTTRYFLPFIVAFGVFGVWQQINYNVCIALGRIQKINRLILGGPIFTLIVYLLYWMGYIHLGITIIFLIAVANQFYQGLVSVSTILSKPTRGYHSATRMSDVFSYGLLVYASNLVQFLVYRFDYWILEKHDLRHFAFYTLASSMVSLLWFIPQRVADISFVATAEKSEDIMAKIVRSARLLFYAQLVLGLLSMLGLWLLFRILGMQQFDDSLAYFAALLLPSSLFGMSIIFSSYQAGSRHLKINFYGSLLTCIFAITLSLLLIPRFGVWGTVAESSVVYISAFIYHYYSFKKYCNLSYKVLFSNPIKDIQQILNEENFSLSQYISKR